MADSGISWFDRMPEYTSASDWRDMTNGELLAERAAKTGLVVIALLLAAGTVFAIYLSLQATAPVYDKWGWYAGKESIAPVATVPAVLGGGGVIGLSIYAFKINFETGKRGSAPEDNGVGANAEKRDQLRGTLKDVYKLYHHKNGGLRTLVEREIISIEQGTKLSALLRSYHESQLVIEDFMCRTNAQLVKENSQDYPPYKRAQETLENLEGQWKKIQTNCHSYSLTQKPSKDTTN